VPPRGSAESLSIPSSAIDRAGHDLAPQQRAQYKGSGSFEVTGSDSGTRYRIWRARQMNIEELDSDGNFAAIWCFLPKGWLPCGDVMLAQKLALENDEQAALAVAKRGHTRAPFERL
jgi:hypothetical protein